MKKPSKRAPSVKKAAKKQVTKRPAPRAARPAPKAARPAPSAPAGSLGVAVKEIMSREVKTARPDTTLEGAIDMMVTHEIGHLPIVDDGGVLLGIVSKSDVIRERFLDGETREIDQHAALSFLDELLNHGFHEAVEVQRTVADVMSPKVHTISEGSTVGQAAEAMAKHRIHGLPVVSKNNVVVGMISTFDIVSWVAAH